mgnify:CR=1 FL=1
MKARIPPGNRLSRKQKTVIWDYVNERERDSTRRILKLVCVVLIRSFSAVQCDSETWEIVTDGR